MGEYLFTSLLKCSECEHNFVINSSTKRNRAYYVCGTRTCRRDGCHNKLHLDHKRLEDQITKVKKRQTGSVSRTAVSDAVARKANYSCNAAIIKINL